MTAPESLPAKLFLLALHTRNRRAAPRDELGFALRAAALASLLASGHLRDEDGKAVVVSATVADPVLAAVLAEVGQERYSWRRLLDRRTKQVYRAVRDQLADARVIRLEEARFLGLIPYTRIELRDRHEADRIAELVGRAIKGGQPVSKVDADTAMLAALAAAAQLRGVLGAGERRTYRARLDQFAAPIEPVTKALRRAVRARRAAMASSG